MSKTLRMTNEQLANHNRKLGQTAPAAAKRSKYNNTKVVDSETGKTIDSKREAKHLKQLRMALRAGEFDFLATQVEFRLEGARYIADFLTGRQNEHGLFEMEIIDSKGVRTAVFKRSKKQMAERYGVGITEW